jgi:hypothetical protein
MMHKKQLLLRTLTAGTLICCLSTLFAYVWTDGGEGLDGLLVWFVAIVAFISGTVLAFLIQIIFIKLNRQTAYTITAIIFLGLIALALWGI